MTEKQTKPVSGPIATTGLSKSTSEVLTLPVGGSELLQSNQFKSLALRSMFWRPDYIQGTSAWVEHLPFAFWIVEALQPSLFVELGTHYGHSYFSFCQAIKRLGLNTPSYAVDTWKGDDQAGHYDETVYQQVDSYNQANYPEFSSLLRCTFDDAISRFNDGSIDLLHIDGFHTYEAVRHDFESWLPKLSDRAVVLFHDTNVRRDLFGVHKYFAELTGRYPSFEFFHGHGLGVLGVGKDQPELLRSLYKCYNHQASRNIVYEVFSRLGRSCHDLMNLTEVREESNIRVNHITQLEQVAGERGAEIERLNGEIARLNEEAGAKTSLLAYLEQVAGERGAEIERLNGELARLNEEAGAKTSHLAHLEQVAGERDAQIERLNVELSEKSEVLNRYIQESAQMARMIIEAQENRDEWRRMSVTAEVEEVIPGSRHEVGEHQHINYTLRGITHLGRKFSRLDVRIVQHHGKPGLVIMEPIQEERPFYEWECHGEENGRGYMIIIPSEKNGKNRLARATTNDLLLTKDVVTYIQKDLLKNERNQKWNEVCTEFLIGIDNIPQRLHYDDVRKLGENNGIIEVEIVNPSVMGKRVQTSIIQLRKNEIQSASIKNSKYNNYNIKTKDRPSSIFFIKERNNMLFHIKKR
jgi:Methyltransferase domain